MSSNRTAFYGDDMLFNDQGHTARTPEAQLLPADHILLEMTPKRPACFEWILVENGSCHGCNAAGVEQAPESKAAPVELLSCESPWVLGAFFGGSHGSSNYEEVQYGDPWSYNGIQHIPNIPKPRIFLPCLIQPWDEETLEQQDTGGWAKWKHQRRNRC